MNNRDKLLIRAGRWIGQFEVDESIIVPSIMEKEDEVSEFVVNAVADYILSKSTDDFDQYFVDIMNEKYRAKG